MKTATKEKPDTITTATFNSLLRSAELQSGDDLEVVGFQSDLGCFHITFTGREENDYTLELTKMDFAFGKMRGSHWVDYSPTPAQLTAMQNKIYDAVNEINEEKLRVEADYRREQMKEEKWLDSFNRRHGFAI